jgi:hypothetical protein
MLEQQKNLRVKVESVCGKNERNNCPEEKQTKYREHTDGKNSLTSELGPRRKRVRGAESLSFHNASKL